MNHYEQLKMKLANCQPIVMSNLMVTASPLLIGALTASDCVLIDK